jgi:hypothetical protein
MYLLKRSLYFLTGDILETFGSHGIIRIIFWVIWVNGVGVEPKRTGSKLSPALFIGTRDG